MAEELVLGYLDLEYHQEIPDSGQFAADHGLDHSDLVNVIKSLHGARYVDAQDIKREKWLLTDEGKKYAVSGSPEVQLYLAVPALGSISRDELEKRLDPSIFKIGCAQAGKNKWVGMGKHLSRKVKVEDVEDRVQKLLLKIQYGETVEGDDIKVLKARKLIIQHYHEGLGKQVEIGNSGIFRPEMLRPMEFPEDVRVIAWGLSLERHEIDNIRDLFGHKVDLGLIKKSPICSIGI